MKKTRLKKEGKIGKINREANKTLRQIYWEKGITTCEAHLKGCMKDFGLSWHHRHKRVNYRKNPDGLSKFNETILVCSHCHQEAEKSRALTEKLFKQLR